MQYRSSLRLSRIVPAIIRRSTTAPARGLLVWASVLAVLPVALLSRRLFVHVVEQANATGGLGRCVGQMWAATLGAGAMGGNIDLLTSPAMRLVRSLVDRVARTNAPVIIRGESGVGKEVVARAIQARSARAGRPFFKVNCAALPHDLLQAELFGHEKGSFTHADTTRRGWFERANGATLLLDEITEVPVELQASLLHVVQDGEFFRIGGQRPIAADVHLIAATRRDLRAAVEAGEFREDLYYRLNVIEIHVPPLRERRQEIPALIAHFRDRFAALYGRRVELDPATLDVLVCYDWPGNVRELENTVHRIAVLGTEAALQMMTSSVRDGACTPPRTNRDEAIAPLKQAVRLAVSEAQRIAIVAALSNARWNRSAAARALGIGPRALRDKLAELGIAAEPIADIETAPNAVADAAA